MSNQTERTTSHNVMLVCRTAEGQPTFFAAKVVCTSEQYDEVEYLDAVCEAAEQAGFVITEEIPTLCDDADPLGKILDYGADWDTAPTITLPSNSEQIDRLVAVGHL